MKTNDVPPNGVPEPCWMIVDDNETILTLVRSLVECFTDRPIECFLSPEAALLVFQAAPERFEFVITDLEMPGMNGTDFCRRLHETSPALKVLLSTGSEILTDDQAAARGFCGLLHKPMLMQSLKTVLSREGLIRGKRKYTQDFFRKNTGLHDGLRLPGID